MGRASAIGDVIDVVEGTIAIHRADLQAVLGRAAADLRLGTEVTSVADDAGAVAALLAGVRGRGGRRTRRATKQKRRPVRISRPSPAMTGTLIALVFSTAGNGMAAKPFITGPTPGRR